MTLRGSLVWSAVIHVGLLMAGPPLGWKPARALRTFEVSYAPVLAPSVSSTPAPVARVVQPSVAPVSEKVPSPPVAFAPFGGFAKPVSAPLADFVRPAAPVRSAVVEKLPLPPGHAVASVLPEWQFALLQHKEQVRSYLKPRLRYPAVQVEGTVRLRLFLTSEGLLRRAEVLAASDPRLTEAALRDARAAAPYPRFPSAMRRKLASYEFLVRYQPE